MSITIDLPPETEEKLRQRAAAVGREMSEFVLEVVKQELRREFTFDEIVAPIRQGFEESEMTDDEVDELLEQAIKEVREEKRKARA